LSKVNVTIVTIVTAAVIARPSVALVATVIATDAIGGILLGQVVEHKVCHISRMVKIYQIFSSL
jgi:hypothetical protein